MGGGGGKNKKRKEKGNVAERTKNETSKVHVVSLIRRVSTIRKKDGSYTRFRSLSTMALAEERAAEERMIQGNGLCAGLSQMARERKRNNLKWSPHVMYARPSILHYECTRVQHTPGTSDYDDDDDDDDDAMEVA